MRKLTTNEFIQKAKEIHSNKYDYSKVNYLNSKSKICIVCPIHGEFYQIPNSHLNNRGCPKCGNNFKYTTLEFIQKAKEVHGNMYDYSKVKYVNNHIKVCIICPIHGEFWQTPNSHLNGNGCSKCVGLAKLNTDEFIQRAKEVHGNMYDYSKVKYVNIRTKVCIICSKHGEFWQTPHKHLNGNRCSKCVGVCKSDTIDFIKKAKEIHGDKYDYSKTEYEGAHKKICIICPEHGEFWQTPNSHLKNNGCSKCSLNYQLNTNEFIQKAKEVHGNMYDYSKVKYVNTRTKVCIICSKHGEFYQSPTNHINQKHGCPICRESKIEKYLKELLDIKGINFNFQKRFKWLGKQSLDFYLPNYNIAIECQGKQHFHSNFQWGGGLKELCLLQKRDEKKYELCKKHGIRIMYFTFEENNPPKKYIDKIYTDFDVMIKEILTS